MNRQIPRSELSRVEGVKVLMVDDDPDTRDAIKGMLEQYRVNVETAASAVEALSKISLDRYDVVLSDIRMPDVSGYEFIEKLRALGPQRGGDVPAIAITACARTEERLQSLTSGFQEHVSKPFEPEELAGAISKVIREK